MSKALSDGVGSKQLQAGFSLVELSIVLVILGLLTGGVLTGQNLIRAAELRSVVTEFQKYQTAVQTFRDKYFALPGDMTNATDFWQVGADCSSRDTTGGTCSGTGDGIIDPYEAYTFWQHLSEAGLIEGDMAGMGGWNSGRQMPGADAAQILPASKIGNAYWGVYNLTGSIYEATYTFHGATKPMRYRHSLIIDEVTSTGFFASYSPLGEMKPFIAEEAWGIDKKVDDGLPFQGSVESMSLGGNQNCAAATADAQYTLMSDRRMCRLIFANAF